MHGFKEELKGKYKSERNAREKTIKWLHIE
jgi:hypothetical protein